MADDITGNTIPDISNIISELLSNKELLAKIEEISDSAQQSDTSQPSASSIESLISNPNLISKLPEIIGVIKPFTTGGDQNESKASVDKRIGLLIAMKPYLSPKRCEAIDYIARMSRLSEAVKGLKL